MIGDKYKYYEILNVPQNAEKDQIKTSFKKLAIKWHPDKNKGRENECKDAFIKIYTAYQVLLDNVARKEYDDFLAALRQSQQIDELLQQEKVFKEWRKKSKKDAEKQYNEFKVKGDDFVDILINVSVGIINITGIGIKKIFKAGKNVINKTFNQEQKEKIKKISLKTAKGARFFFRSLFNVILWSGFGLMIGWFLGEKIVDESSHSIFMNVVWLGVTLISLIYNFIFRKPAEEDLH